MQGGPSPIYRDSNVAIKLSKNPVLQGRGIYVKFHFLRDLAKEGVINLFY